MYPVSEAFLQVVQENTRRYHWTGRITTKKIRTILETLEMNSIETELIQLGGEIIEPSKACWACGGNGNCVYKNDKFHEIFEKMKAAVISDMNSGLFTHKVGVAVDAARRAGQCRQ